MSWSGNFCCSEK